MHNQILLSSGSLSNWGTDRVFEFARLAGFDGVEMIVDGRTDTAHGAYLQKLVARHGVPVPAVHAPFNFIDPPGWEKEEVPRVKRSARLAEELGARLLVMHTPFFTDAAYRRWLEEDLPAFQASSRVILALENMPCHRKIGGRWGVWLQTPTLQEAGMKKIWKLVPNFLIPPCYPLSDPERLSRFPYLVLDTTHLGTGGHDPVAVFGRLRERIVHIHLSNFDGREHLELRQGIIDMGRFLRHLKESGYRGMLCLEIMPELFPSHEDEFTIDLLKANLKLIRENLS